MRIASGRHLKCKDILSSKQSLLKVTVTLLGYGQYLIQFPGFSGIQFSMEIICRVKKLMKTWLFHNFK